MPDISLKLRLVLTILVLALLSTFFISDRALVLTKKQIILEQSRVLKHAATLISSTLYMELVNQAEKVEFFANLPQLRSGKMSTDERQSLLEHIKSTNSHYAWVGLTDTKGRVIQAAENLLVGADVSQRGWFLQGRSGTAFGDAHPAILLESLLTKNSTAETLRLIDISTSVTNTNGEPIYVLAIHLNLLWAQEIKRQMLAEIGDSNIQIIVIDHNQHPVISSSDDLQRELQSLELFTASAPLAVWKEQEQTVEWPDGKLYLTAASMAAPEVNSPSLGWSIIARKPLSAVYEPAKDFAGDVFWYAVIIFLTFMGVVWLALDRTLHPLMRLAEIADQIRQSQAHATLPELEGNSEVARFSRSLTRLVNELTSKNKELVLAERMFSDNRLAIMVTDAERNIIRVNRAFTQFTGFSFDDVRGEKPTILSSGRHDTSFYDSMNLALEEQGSWRGEIWNKHKSGHLYPEFLTIISLTNENNEVTNYIGMFEDISEQKGRERSLDKLKNFDSLTNLPNREAGIRSLNAAIEESKRSQEPFAVIFIDISGFKTVNELFGHRVGDQLLRQVARRLMSIAIEQGFLARWGGDEFMLYASRADRPIANKIASQLLDAMSHPFHSGDEEHHLNVHCGVALYPEDATDSATLLRFADIAMLEAKKSRKGPVLFYKAEMNDQVVRHMELEGALRRSIDKGYQEFELYYQPQVDSSAGVIKGYEALIRWNPATLGPVQPDQFINLAESSGLIEPLGRWIIEHGCKALKALIDQAGRDLTLSINVSGVQLQNPNFVDELIEYVTAAGVKRNLIVVEVTETAFMGSDSGANQVLETVRAAGFGVSIDDFGTGYASLDYIQRFKPTEIKIDRLFIDKMLSDSHCMNIVKFTIHLAQSMELEVVAEGVETQQQLEALNALGPVIGQGYLLGRPVPLHEALANLTPG